MGEWGTPHFIWRRGKHGNRWLPTAKFTKVKLTVNENPKPTLYKPRPIPHSLQGKVEQELQSLQEQSIISPVKTSEWAAPVVPVLKRNGAIRLCGDYKLTLNQIAPTESYPLPRAEEMYATLAGGKLFTKLDISSAYLHLPLDPESKKYTTIKTHKGLSQYNRLPFGVASAPAIFQRFMDTLLQGIPNVSVYIDDI